jgi:DNA-binding CsgD family transcriptional regulator
MEDFAKAFEMKKTRPRKSNPARRGRPRVSDSGKILSTREEDILSELKAARTYQQIADIYCISINTVKTHARKIYKKLEVKNKVEAINKFFQSN